MKLAKFHENVRIYSKCQVLRQQSTYYLHCVMEKYATFDHIMASCSMSCVQKNNRDNMFTSMLYAIP